MTPATTLAGLTLSLACTLAVTPALSQKGKTATQQTAPAVNVVQLYTANCERCHVGGNSPTKELNFADGEWKHGSSLSDVVNTITNGVAGTAMLPWKERFTQEEIAALAKYVRSFDKSLAPGKGRPRGRGALPPKGRGGQR